MEHACLRHTEIPGTSRLFADFQYHFDKVAQFFRYDPAQLESYRAAAREIQYPDDRRAALIQALRRSQENSLALERLAKFETVAVVTGQQVTLFGGPAYTIYKALTAAKLAEELNRAGIPAVPVFWLATEDHDFAEANHCHVFDEAQRPVELRITANGAANRPMEYVCADEFPLTELERALQHLPYAKEAVAFAQESYQPGLRIGQAFERLMRCLLGKLDFVYFDPMQPEIRDLAAPFLREAVLRSDHLGAKLIERGRELAGAGYHAQVHFEADTSLFFLLDGERRIGLRRRDGGYAAPGHWYSREELADFGGKLSPNALLRPVMQDYLLPTVSYIGGPGEVVYLAQSEVLYRDLLGRMPVTRARSGFTLIDERSHRRMERYGLAVTDLFEGEERVRERMAAKLTPPELLGRFAESRREAERLTNKLRTSIIGFDPTLAKAMEKSSAKILYQIAKMEDKTKREAVRRDERALRDAASFSGLVFPEKHLQERFYAILPFIAQYGSGIIDELYARVHLDCPDHQVATI